MSKDWAQRLAEAGWQAGDIYVPPSSKRQTTNARLSGLAHPVEESAEEVLAMLSKAKEGTGE